MFSVYSGPRHDRALLALVSDCCVEKGALHRNVYPVLRAACRERGYELHIVDLHWRTPLEKQQDHEFPQLCLGELARKKSALSE